MARSQLLVTDRYWGEFIRNWLKSAGANCSFQNETLSMIEAFSLFKCVQKSGHLPCFPSKVYQLRREEK